MKKKTKQKRAPGGGRKTAYGEPTVAVSVRLPQRVVDLLDGLGPTRNAALVGIVTTSVQYRLRYRSRAAWTATRMVCNQNVDDRSL